MRTVDKSMVHIDGKRKYQTTFAGYSLAGSHQRITATVACFGKCIGYRGEIHFGNRTQMDHIVIALLGKNLFGSIRVTVLGHVCYQGVGFGIETFKVFVIGNAHGIECFPRNGYRRNDVHPVVKNNPAFLVGTVTEFIDFIGRTHHSIQIIKEKGALCSPGCSTGFRAVNLCGDGIPGIYKIAEKAVVIPAFLSINVYNVFHTKRGFSEKRMPFYKHPFSNSIYFSFL